MRKRTFVTSLFSKESIRGEAINAAQRGLGHQVINGLFRANKERKGAIQVLAAQHKRIVLLAPKSAGEKEKLSIARFVESMKKQTGNKHIRIVWAEDKSYYASPWQRDLFTRLGKRILNKVRVEDFRTQTRNEARFFADGGRIIEAGTRGRRKILLVSVSPISSAGKQMPVQEKYLLDEIEMLKKRGYVVFGLPGFEYRPLGRSLGANARGTFFEHLDVFVNTIPERRLLLVDPDYYKAHTDKISRIADFLRYKIISVPEKEKYVYPANFLPIGNGSIIMDKGAKETIKILKENGVNVFSTPHELKGNNELGGGIRCFVNEA